jgi:ribosomal protein S18 acetylase RimI-like enzyme
VPSGPLPDGYKIRPLAGEQEVAAYVELHQSVFQSKNMTEAWRRRTLQRAEYRPLIDLVVEAPDHQLAAFCICWFDENGPGNRPSGQIEPLGVSAAHRNLGLGRAILCEGLRRLHAMGAQQVFVETDNYRDAAFRLYESAGFRVKEDVLVYRKDYDA